MRLSLSELIGTSGFVGQRMDQCGWPARGVYLIASLRRSSRPTGRLAVASRAAPPQGPFRIDRRLETLGGLLAEETENRCRLGPAYFEWLASALAANVLSRLHAPRGVPVHSGIRRAIEYIELHLTEPVSLAELAEQAPLSRSYFALRFEQVTGYTPHHFLLLVRLGHARKLLAEAKLSLPEIAAASGFSDQAHMSRLFQRFSARRRPLFGAHRGNCSS